MAKQTQIRLKLSPVGSGVDERAPLYEFANICAALKNCLKNISRCTANEDSEFAVSNLEIGSAVLVAEPYDAASTVVPELFNETIAALQEGRELNKILDFKAINCFKGFSAVVKNPSLAIDCGGIHLTESYINNLAKLLEPSSPSCGSVSGRLETFSVHRHCEFILYPTIPGEQVTCKFNKKYIKEVLRAVERNVTVYGVLHYAPAKIFPVSVDVESFEVSPPNDSLPSLLDAKGIMRSTNQHLIDGGWDAW